MKKQIIRFFSLLMLVVLLVTAFAMQVNARVVFSDLAPTHWCYNKIIDFESKGYVCGYEDGTFKADQTITRAEYVKIVNNFFGYKQNTEKVANFSDVNSGDWFAPYVNEAVERGYITGFEDGTFRPQDPIRRQEATVILARILGIDKEVYPANHIDGLAQYSDSDEVQDWARVAIHSYSVYNFINGYTDGTLKILQNVTRAETVELLHVLEQKIIIDRKPGGSSKSTVKMPTIALYRFDKEANEFAAIQSSDLKSNWVNKAISTLSGDEDGVLVNITSTTTGATINETLTGNKAGERKYITSKIEELTNAIFLTDGEYKISAFASKSGYHSSSSADKTILVDTKAPVVSGEVVTTLPVAHEQQVKVTIADPKANDVNRISGLDTSKVRYAWFKDNGEGVYEKATEWQNVILDTNGNKVITTEGLEYGTYKLAISAYDIAENPYGDKIDTVVTTSGDEEFREEIPYDFVEEIEKEGEEKPENPDITVIVGNNAPEVENLVMRTEVNVEVSGKIVATDKDGDTLTYTLVESGDSACAKVSGDTTTFKHRTVGIYYYNVEVSDDNGGTARALVTVYVYDISVVTPSGDKEDPDDYDVLANDLILYVGEKKDATASATPQTEDSTDATFEWNEDSEKIDIVNDSQNKPTVTIEGKVPGKAKMDVTVKVGEAEITRTINVVVKGRKLTIHYVYENGTQASGDYVIEEVGKDGYSVTSPAIEGYTPDVAVVSGDMLTKDTEITVKYKANEKPKLAITTFVRKNKDDKEPIDKLVYKEDGDNTYWYVIKVENTIKDSNPEVVDSADIIDELPSYLKFVSGDATSGTISSGDSAIIWNAEDIGYGNKAQYAYIKVEVDKSAFSKYEEKEETKNTISNIKAEVKSEDLTNTSQNVNRTSFFIRYANPVDAETGSGYLYAGNTTISRNQLPFGWEPGNNIFIENSKTNRPYTDKEINEILDSKDKSKISEMLEDFVNGQEYIKKYISTKNDCSSEAIRNNVSKWYSGNVTISGTQVVLWYKFIKVDDGECKREGYKIYSITSKNDNNTTSTVDCKINYPANAYHLDGLVVDIKILTTIPEGSAIDISNTAKIDGTGEKHTSTIKLYYESEKENIGEDVTTLELDIGEGDPLLDDETLEVVSNGDNENEQPKNEEENISGDSNVVEDDEVISSGDTKVEEEQKVEDKNEEQQEESKVEENKDEEQEEPKAEEKNEEQQEEPKVEENKDEKQEETKVEENKDEEQEEPKAEEKNEEQQEEPKVEENKDEKQEETKVEENKDEEQEEPKAEEKNEEQQEEPKVEENKDEEQEETKVEENKDEKQEEPKAEEKNEEQQEESKIEENKDEEQEESKAEEKNEEQQEESKVEENKDEIIAVKPQVPSTEPQETSTDKDDEQE